MDHDLLMMLYGALIGAVSRVMTSMVESAFQRWLERHDQEKRQAAEHSRQSKQIYLPTAEEVQAITSQQYEANQAAAQHKGVGAGTVIVSVAGSLFLVHQAREPILSLGFAALISYLVTHNLFKRLGR